MTWKIRSLLIVAAAVLVYGILYWVLQRAEHGGSPGGAKAPAFVAAPASVFGAGGPREALEVRLEGRPGDAAPLLLGWGRADLVQVLGWPQRAQGNQWWYPMNGSYLVLRWGPDNSVAQVLWQNTEPE
ncbi:MAG: hypothetical protein R3F17_11935 [Planctomycetota bacterium]